MANPFLQQGGEKEEGREEEYVVRVESSISSPPSRKEDESGRGREGEVGGTGREGLGECALEGVRLCHIYSFDGFRRYTASSVIPEA